MKSEFIQKGRTKRHLSLLDRSLTSFSHEVTITTNKLTANFIFSQKENFDLNSMLEIVSFSIKEKRYIIKTEEMNVKIRKGSIYLTIIGAVNE